MTKRKAAVASAILGLATAVSMLSASPALAHEERTVGAYHFLVGWGTEPAYAGVENSVQLILATGSGEPINTLGDTLKVEVVFGNQRMSLPLELNFDPDSGEGSPGDYRAWMIPTVPGNYTFHFTGSIGTQEVDQSFTSGPTTFATVADPAGIQFPVKQPPANEVAALAQRLSTRLEAAVAAQKKAQQSANKAKVLGYVGIAVGVVGLLIGATAVIMARRRPAPTQREAPVPAGERG